MTRLCWVVLRTKTVVSFPWSDVGKQAAHNAAGATGKVAIGVRFVSGNDERTIEHTLHFDPNTGREIES